MADEPTPAEEQKLATWEALQAGQVYLSKEEIFAQEMINEAFVGTDGVDLRSSLAIDNVLTGAAMVNWLDTDTVLRALIGALPNFTALFRQIQGVSQQDAEFIDQCTARVVAETPPANLTTAQQVELAHEELPSTIASAPANTYLTPTGQIALRIMWVVQNSRVITAANQNFKQLAFKIAKDKDPALTPARWAQLMGLTATGISGIRGRFYAGIGGNFFKDLGRSISRLFKNPLATFRRWAIEIGRGMQAIGKVGQWLTEKVPFIGAATGFLPVVLGELGHALAEQNINAFNEQLVTYTAGLHLQQIGTILTILGMALQAFPVFGTIIGGILIAVGALCIIAGNTILQLFAMVRRARLENEAYLANLAALKRARQAQEDALRATGQPDIPVETQAAPKTSSAGLVAGIVGIAAILLLKH